MSVAARLRLHTAVIALLAVGACLFLKLHYRQATAEQLDWVLQPLAVSVGTLVGAPFEAEPGMGYLSHSLRYLIAPACAGVNFMVVAFLSGVFGFLGCIRTAAGRWGVLALSAAGAYLLGLVANTLRLTGAVLMRREGLHPFDLEPALWHQLWGTAVFVGTLCVAYSLTRRLMGRRVM